MDGSRGRVAQLWLLVVAPAPSGYAVQPADSSVAPRCWRQRLQRSSMPVCARSANPPSGELGARDLEIESLPARQDARTGTVQWSIGITDRAK